jgi:hypothetical protein
VYLEIPQIRLKSLGKLMLQYIDKMRLYLVDLVVDSVWIVYIAFFIEKSIKEFQGRRPEDIFRRGGHQFTDEEIFKKFQPVLT